MGMKEMKDAYVAKMEAQLSEWGAKLKEMKAKAEKAAAQGRLDYQQRLEKVRAQEKHDQARRKLDEVKAAGEDRWEALKAGVEGAWKELKKSVDSAKVD
jgi:hypothetical protein